jgi:hypothetical protein
VDPVTLMTEITADVKALDATGRELGKAIKVLAESELKYEQALQSQLVTQLHDAKETGQRLPGEQLRSAIAHQQIDSKVYAEYLSRVPPLTH